MTMKQRASPERSFRLALRTLFFFSPLQDSSALGSRRAPPANRCRGPRFARPWASPLCIGTQVLRTAAVASLSCSPEPPVAL